MTKEKVESLLLHYKDIIPSDKVIYLKNSLDKANDESFEKLSIIKTYNPVTVCVLSIFLGGLGVDRFFIGDVGLGICKLLFGWLTFGIWPLIDIFCSYKKSKEKNFNNLISSL